MNENTLIVPDESLPQRKESYPAERAKIRKRNISQVVSAGAKMVHRFKQKTNLSNLDEVMQIADEYQRKCAELSVLPNVEGFCASMGLSRDWVYQYLEQYGETESARYIDVLRHVWASNRQALAETEDINPAAAIFILKNSGMNFADKCDYSVQAKAEQPWERRPPWAYGMDDEAYRKALLEEMEAISDSEA